MLIHNNYKISGVIDFHVHAFPDHVAPSAREALSNYGLPFATNCTISGLLDVMDRDDVNYSVVLPVATKPTQVRSINDWAASNTDPRVIMFGGIHPDYEDVDSEMERIVSLGMPGNKIKADWPYQ